MANISMETIKELRERTGVGIMECKKALQETDGDIDKAVRLLKEKGAVTAAKKTDREVKEGAIGFFLSEDKTKVACVELHCETDFVAKNELFVNLSKTLAKIAIDNPSVESLLNAKGDNGETVQAMINEGIQKWGENTVLASVKVMTTNGFFGTYTHFNNKLVTIVDVNVKPNDKCVEIANQIAMHIASEKPLALNRDGVDANAVREQREIFEKQVRDAGKPENMIEKIVEGKMSSWYSESVLIDQKLFTDNKISIKSLVDEMSKESGSTAEIKDFAIVSLGV